MRPCCEARSGPAEGTYGFKWSVCIASGCPGLHVVIMSLVASQAAPPLLLPPPSQTKWRAMLKSRATGGAASCGTRVEWMGVTQYHAGKVSD